MRTIYVLAAVCLGCGAQVDDKTRIVEIEWRIPDGADKYVPTDTGTVIVPSSTGQGPVRQDQLSKESKFTVVKGSELIFSHTFKMYVFLKFSDYSLPKPLWLLEAPKRGLNNEWSTWRRADFVDGDPDFTFKMLRGERSSPKETPAEMSVELRYRVGSYFKP